MSIELSLSLSLSLYFLSFHHSGKEVDYDLSRGRPRSRLFEDDENTAGSLLGDTEEDELDEELDEEQEEARARIEAWSRTFGVSTPRSNATTEDGEEQEEEDKSPRDRRARFGGAPTSTPPLSSTGGEPVVSPDAHGSSRGDSL